MEGERRAADGAPVGTSWNGLTRRLEGGSQRLAELRLSVARDQRVLGRMRDELRLGALDASREGARMEREAAARARQLDQWRADLAQSRVDRASERRVHD